MAWDVSGVVARVVHFGHGYCSFMYLQYFSYAWCAIRLTSLSNLSAILPGLSHPLSVMIQSKSSPTARSRSSICLSFDFGMAGSVNPVYMLSLFLL